MSQTVWPVPRPLGARAGAPPLLAQGLRPFDAACLGVMLHGLAGEAVRERLGDSGLIASDLPIEIAHARRRLADIAERRRREGRLGFAVRDEGRPGASS